MEREFEFSSEYLLNRSSDFSVVRSLGNAFAGEDIPLLTLTDRAEESEFLDSLVKAAPSLSHEEARIAFLGGVAKNRLGPDVGDLLERHETNKAIVDSWSGTRTEERSDQDYLALGQLIAVNRELARYSPDVEQVRELWQARLETDEQIRSLAEVRGQQGLSQRQAAVSSALENARQAMPAGGLEVDERELAEELPLAAVWKLAAAEARHSVGERLADKNPQTLEELRSLASVEMRNAAADAAAHVERTSGGRQEELAYKTAARAEISTWYGEQKEVIQRTEELTRTISTTAEPASLAALSYQAGRQYAAAPLVAEIDFSKPPTLYRRDEFERGVADYQKENTQVPERSREDIALSRDDEKQSRSSALPERVGVTSEWFRDEAGTIRAQAERSVAPELVAVHEAYLNGRRDSYNSLREDAIVGSPSLAKDLPAAIQVDEIRVRQAVLEQEQSLARSLSSAR